MVQMDSKPVNMYSYTKTEHIIKQPNWEQFHIDNSTTNLEQFNMNPYTTELEKEFHMDSSTLE